VIFYGTAAALGAGTGLSGWRGVAGQPPWHAPTDHRVAVLSWLEADVLPVPHLAEYDKYITSIRNCQSTNTISAVGIGEN